VEGCDPCKVPVNCSVQINIWQGEEKIPSALLGLLTTQTTCSHKESLSLQKVTINIWHLWCDVLSPLCLTYPVLPVKTSLTNRSSSCCGKSRQSSLSVAVLPFHPRCRCSERRAIFGDIAQITNWHMEIFGSVQILYPDI